MSEQQFLDIMNQGLWVAVECCGPLLAIGGAVGLLAALVQAATQLNEASLTFVPKLVALGLALVVLGPWLLDRLVGYNVELYRLIGEVGVHVN